MTGVDQGVAFDCCVAAFQPKTCLHQVFAGEHLEGVLVDDPLRDEGADAAMRANDAQGVRNLVVHQQREGAVAVVERAHAVGNADHAVTAGRCRRDWRRCCRW